MATKKKTSAPVKSAPPVGGKAPATRSTRSFEHGKKAAGAKYIREGFAWTPEGDLAFALGFPYVTYLVGGHPDDDEKDLELLRKLVVSKQYSLDVPAGIALKRARVFAIYKVGRTNADAVESILERQDPITLTEARTMIKKAIADDGIFGAGIQRMLQILEAVLGPSDLAETLMTALEGLPKRDLAGSTGARLFARFLGFSLLRVTTAESTTLRGRLEQLGKQAARGPVHENIENILGRAQEDPDDAAFMEADFVKIAAFVAKVSDSPILPNARLAFLGGDALLEWYAKKAKAKKIDAYELQTLIPEFAPMAGERALDFLLLLTALSKAKVEATATFVANASRTRAYLEKTSASKDEKAALAKAVLGHFPKG